ncbi:flagellar protein FlgN [Aurantimonas aggregata]|uniref:Flagellar protein FlgN n=1 Tax=Aurantimonas aggregata TaxID=2047720 RepID=A0A6L9MDR9_9HYPH|nr:flagellar protein FlgN [Aurantimonas aggregata]NDV85722.1 flagellar protein FlgN [Aurantimonas aggregata]
MNIALAKAVDRLEEILAAETAALDRGTAIDLAEITGRKNQSLLELTRLAKSVPATRDPALDQRLGRLKDVVEANRNMLELHVRASHDISALISRSIAESESDGTYSAALGRRDLPR